MSLESFRAIASAYDGDPNTSSHITFPETMARERVFVGSAGQELIGVWRVHERDGGATYHVVHSDAREGSGTGISRTVAAQADGPAGISIRGTFEESAVHIAPDGTAKLGEVSLQPLVEMGDFRTSDFEVLTAAS